MKIKSHGLKKGRTKEYSVRRTYPLFSGFQEFKSKLEKPREHASQ